MAEKTFTVSQVWLHWTITVLIFLQYFTGDPTVAFVESGNPTLGTQSGAASYHMVMGIVILALAGARVALRFIYGSPDHPKNSPMWLQKLARSGHETIYVMLFAVPILGMMGLVFETKFWLYAHVIAEVILMIVVIGHVAGVIYEGVLTKWESFKPMWHFKK